MERKTLPRTDVLGRLVETIQLLLFSEGELFDLLLNCRSFYKGKVTERRQGGAQGAAEEQNGAAHDEWDGPLWLALFALPLLACYSVYGFAMGWHVALRHAWYLAVRLPFAALLTGLFGFPPLLFLTRRYPPARLSLWDRVGQLGALLAGQIAITGMSLLAFVPFLLLMAWRDPAPPVFQGGNVILVGASAIFGLLFLVRGFTHIFGGSLPSWSIGFGLVLYVTIAFEWAVVWGPYFGMAEAFAQARLPEELLKAILCPRFDAENIAQAVPSLFHEIVRLLGDWLK